MDDWSDVNFHPSSLHQFPFSNAIRFESALVLSTGFQKMAVAVVPCEFFESHSEVFRILLVTNQIKRCGARQNDSMVG
jgi:hypothetical protein